MSGTLSPPRPRRQPQLGDKSARQGSRVVVRLLAVGAYAVTLHLVYVEWISPAFNYVGFSNDDIGVVDSILAGSMIAFFTVTLPDNLARPGRFVSWWLFLTLTIPVTLIPLYQPGDVPLRMWVFAAMAGATTTIFGRLDRLPTVRRPNVRLSEEAFVYLLLAFSGIVMLWALVTLPLHIKFVWLADVQEQRSAFSDSVAGTGGLFSYAFRWQSAAVFPAMMAFGLDRSRRYLVFLGAAGLVLLYGMTGYKQVVLSLIFVPAVYFVLRRPQSRNSPAIWLAGGLTVAAWIAVVLDDLTGTIDFTSIFIRRAVLVSGIYSVQYLSFFGYSGPDLFAHSFLAGIVDSDNIAGPPLTIARAFYGADFSANANFLADGYANLSYAGVAIMACVVGGCLYLANSFTSKADVPAVGAMLIVPTTSLANSAGFATITTHGLGIALVLIALYPRATKSDARAGDSTARRRRMTIPEGPTDND